MPPSGEVLLITSTLVPAAAGNVRLNAPDGSATVLAVLDAVFASVATSATSMRACGSAVPVTVTVLSTALLSAGPVTVSAVPDTGWVT